MDKHTCRNCDNNFTGEYCNNCGQKLAHRITIAHIGHDIMHAFTHADKGFFHMMTELFRNPGKVAKDYIVDEKRKRYFTPFQYLLIIGTVATIVVVNSHFMEGAVKAMALTDVSAASTRQLEMMHKITYLQSKYYNFLILIQLPFFSLSTFWLYKKFRYNYAEHLTLHTFITAQTTLVSMLLMILLFFIGFGNMNTIRFYTALVGLISGAYHIIMYMQFFNEKNTGGFFKALGAYVLGLIIFFVSVIIISVIIGIIVGIIMKKG